MSRTPRPLGVTVVPTFRQQLLSAIYTSTHCILSFDTTSSTPSLITYYWSVMKMFAALHISMFEQARWREGAREAWRVARLSRNPSIPWTVLSMPVADGTQRRVSLHRSSHLRTSVWTLHRRIRGWVCQESMWLSRFVTVIILAEDIRNWFTYHCQPVPLERIYPKVGVPLRIFPTRGKLPVACHGDVSVGHLLDRRLRHCLPSASLSSLRVRVQEFKSPEKDLCTGRWVKKSWHVEHMGRH